MPTNQAVLKEELRTFTGYSELTLTDADLSVVIQRAKKHIRTRKGLDESFDFFATDQAEEALFWWACLFAKVSTGELDSQTVQVGAVDAKTLLSQDGDEVVAWLRNARLALRSLEGSIEGMTMGTGITSPTRDGRDYGDDDSQDTFGNIGG